ncbi:hypothetical protein [Lactobacillus kefiranofaciens]|uniref:Transcriptional regulator n=1 Tax=Lactobacillus kefiranofaciens TaxID=267818 RepID=A0AAX3UDK5_9LACO|nr:hypothetical protein [Lactobacillus kefiranofaciens]AEG41648.1 Hypothetical protein WANG_p1045 [Lactobacillus kefiranofaciens subsp. kefiranofaciens]QFQ68455.1 hypothetical protein LKK75_08765 [Lactobacillus kefiranofaciens subsp. kefiranofaciens]WGO85747.1 hypothetical protein QEJ78_10640 [Lactobacillus kefiranofaciens]WQH36930.1 hypothetical protein U2870_04810 [Lactobacillus kefiranofaciens]SDA69597.1 hypothetical protein SAMN02983011_02226 [Lactobacillus kefiranofaciens]
MSANTTKYSSISVALVDDFIDYSKQLKNSFKGAFNPLVSIYSMITELDTTKQLSNELLLDVKKKLQVLPTFYHVQVTRLFITRFVKELEPDIQETELNRDCVDLEDMLMAACSDFEGWEQKIPSILEVLYLTLRSGIDNKQDTALRSHVNLLVSDRNVQARVLYDFCNKYQDKYDARLKQGVFPSAR